MNSIFGSLALLQDDGTCVKCPVLKSTWSRYSGLLYVLFAIIGAVAVVYIGLLLLVRFRGGTLLGGSVRMVDLGIWALLSAQVHARARRALRFFGVFRRPTL